MQDKQSECERYDRVSRSIFLSDKLGCVNIVRRSAMRAKRPEVEVVDIYRQTGKGEGGGEIPLESEATEKRESNRRELNRNP